MRRARVGGGRPARRRHRRTDPRVVRATDRARPHARRTSLDGDRLHPQVRRRVGRRRARPTARPSQDRHRDAARRGASLRRRRTGGVDPGTITGGRVDRCVQPSRRRRRAGQPVHGHATRPVRRRAHPRTRRPAGPPRQLGGSTRPSRDASVVRAGGHRGVRDLAGSGRRRPGGRPASGDVAEGTDQLREDRSVGQPDLLRSAVPVLARHDRGDPPARLRRRCAAPPVVDERPAGRVGADPRGALPDRRHHHDGSTDGRLRRPRRPRGRGSGAHR